MGGGRTKDWIKLGKGERRGAIEAQWVDRHRHLQHSGQQERRATVGGEGARPRQRQRCRRTGGQIKGLEVRFATGFKYKIHMTAAGSGNCGDVSLLVWESAFGVEEVKVWGANALSLYELYLCM